MLNVKKLLTLILTRITGMFYVKSLTPTGWLFTANQYRKIEISYYDVARTGYTVIIYKADCTSHSALHVFNSGIDDNHVFIEVINRSSSSVPSADFSVKLLYIKSNLIQTL